MTVFKVKNDGSKYQEQSLRIIQGANKGNNPGEEWGKILTLIFPNIFKAKKKIKSKVKLTIVSK